MCGLVCAVRADHSSTVDHCAMPHAQPSTEPTCTVTMYSTWYERAYCIFLSQVVLAVHSTCRRYGLSCCCWACGSVWVCLARESPLGVQPLSSFLLFRILAMLFFVFITVTKLLISATVYRYCVALVCGTRPTRSQLTREWPHLMHIFMYLVIMVKALFHNPVPSKR